MGDYHDLYIESDTLLLADVFQNFRNRHLLKCELDPASFFSPSGLAQQPACKKVKRDLLTDIDMSLIVEKGIRGGKCHIIYQYVKANNKYMKNHHENEESSNLKYWDINKLYR